MNIHIIGSLREFDQDIVYLRAIADVVQTHDHRVQLNWFEAVKDRKERGSRPEESLDWQEIVTNNLDATMRADALIIEGSRFNYSQGYQTAVALAHNKPVLNLYRTSLPDYTDRPDKFFVSGLSNPLFRSVAFETEEDVRGIVAKFLAEITPRTIALDVSLALDPDTTNYLTRLATRTGKSKSGLIKDIITKEANKGDAQS